MAKLRPKRVPLRKTTHGPLIPFKISPEFEKTVKLTEEWPQRLEAAQIIANQALAEILMEEVRAGAQSVEWLAAIYSSMEIVRFDRRYREVKAGGRDVVAIVVENLEEEFEGSELRLKAVFFSAKGGEESMDPLQYALWKYQPWPASLIPWEPDPSQIRAYIKPTTAADDDALRERVWDNWPDLMRIGQRNGAPLPPSPEGISKITEGSYDAVNAILQYEFGMGRRKVAHWRPALRRLKSRMPEVVNKIARILEDPSYNGWKRDVQRLNVVVRPPSVLESIGDFMERVGGVAG